MGTFLSTPVTEFESEGGSEADGLVYGVSAMQGWRSGMEDAHVSNASFDPDTNLSLFAVFDGHGGPEVALFCKAHLAEVLRNTEAFKKCKTGAATTTTTAAPVDTALLGGALQRCFLELDVALSAKAGVKELRRYARAEDRKRQSSLGNVDLEEMTEAAEACGLTLSQLRAVISTQVSERIKNKRRRAGDEEGCSDEDSHSECEDCCEDEAHHHGTTKAAKSSEGAAVGAETGSDGLGGAGLSSSGSKGSPAVDSLALSDAATATVALRSGDEMDASSSTTDEALSDDACSSPEGKENGSSSGGVAGDAESAVSERSSGGGAVVVSGMGGESNALFRDLRPHPRVGGVGVESGATAVVAVLGFDDNGAGAGGGGAFLTVANAGDSRCVLCRGDGVAEDMSYDHKPEDGPELSRVEAAGGSVVEGRIEGNLNLSRAIGDLLYKKNLGVPVERQMITAFPDIKTVRLNVAARKHESCREEEAGGVAGRSAGAGAGAPLTSSSTASSSSPSGVAASAGDSGGGGGTTRVVTDRFFVLACDGIWNSMESQEVVDFVAARLDRGVAPVSVCEEVLDHCLAPDLEGDGTGCDNMTMMVVLLPGFTPACPKQLPTSPSGGACSSSAVGATSAVAAAVSAAESAVAASNGATVTGAIKRPAELPPSSSSSSSPDLGSKHPRSL